MKKVMIKAYNGSGNSKIPMGERECNKPETFSELIDQFNEARIMELTWRSYAIEVQAELRNKNGESAKARLKALEHAAKTDPEFQEFLKNKAELAKTLRAN